MEKTLNGSVKVLIDVLSMADPQSFGVGKKLRDYMRVFAESLHVEKTWELELAAMLSQIGYVTVPPVLLQKFRAGFGLTGPEKDVLERTPEVGSRLLANIPRLEKVARIVLYQAKSFDGTGFPADSVAGEDIPAGARILKVLADLIELEVKGLPRFKALQELRTRTGRYDPKVLDAAFVGFDIYLPDAVVSTTEAIALKDLRVGHVLAAKVETTTGTVIAGPGTEVTQMVMEKFNNFARLDGLKEPIHVQSQAPRESQAAA